MKKSAIKLVRSAEKQISGPSQEIRAPDTAASLEAIRGCDAVSDCISKLEGENAALRK